MNKAKEKISSFWRLLKNRCSVVLGKVYSIIVVVSTLTVFSGVVLFVFGNILKSNKSDNDLIMQEIRDKIGDSEHVSIDTADIHGFGNNSIIVTAYTPFEQVDNNLLILDLISNDILRGMNDLLGIKSNYKTTFASSLFSEEMSLAPEVEYIIDIIGDSTKEIVVNYGVVGSTYDANGAAIYMYSYTDEEYQLIGTYPGMLKLSVAKYDDKGEVSSIQLKEVYTHFDSITDSPDFDFFVCRDQEKTFSLTTYSWIQKGYWVDISGWGRCLVTVKVDRYNENPALINVFIPIYEQKKAILYWRCCYSEYAYNLPFNYKREDIIHELEGYFEGSIVFLEDCSD